MDYAIENIVGDIIQYTFFFINKLKAVYNEALYIGGIVVELATFALEGFLR